MDEIVVLAGFVQRINGESVYFNENNSLLVVLKTI
jgi:hypothetical protein